MHTTLISEEFVRRSHIETYIRAYIFKHFEFSATARIKRGNLHKEVADCLGITVNVPFCQLFNQVMADMGHKMITVTGNYFYRNIKRIDNANT